MPVDFDPPPRGVDDGGAASPHGAGPPPAPSADRDVRSAWVGAVISMCIAVFVFAAAFAAVTVILSASRSGNYGGDPVVAIGFGWPFAALAAQLLFAWTERRAGRRRSARGAVIAVSVVVLLSSPCWTMVFYA
jgi:hypothetical protein